MPLMTTNTRSALVGLFLGTALLLSACGSSGADADDPPAAAAGNSELMSTMPTTSLLEVSTTTVSQPCGVQEVCGASSMEGGSLNAAAVQCRTNSNAERCANGASSGRKP